MIVNQQSLRGIYVGFNTLFNKAFEEVAPIYTEVATITPSTTDSETYAWLGDIPGMREWIGDREIQNLTASYTIKNKDFELTVGVDRNAIEDDKIGLYNPSVQMLGQSAAAHPDELIFALLAGGFSEKCYDGQPFFSDAHKVGKKTISNKTTAKLSMESYIAARASMMSLTNSKGRALNLVPNLLVVPPALEAAARDILVADYISGTKNTMQGTAKPLVVPQLAGHDSAWYLLCASRPPPHLAAAQEAEVRLQDRRDRRQRLHAEDLPLWRGLSRQRRFRLLADGIRRRRHRQVKPRQREQGGSAVSYSTKEEVREMLKDDALNAIIGDTFIEDSAEREELVEPLIEAAIADADAEIDGYLAKRYTVPISPAPRVLNKFSKDIAVYNLFSRIGIDESTDQKTYLNRYNAAIKFLTLVAEGKVSIGTETEDPASAAATGFSAKSNPRLFTRAKMRGM